MRLLLCAAAMLLAAAAPTPPPAPAAAPAPAEIVEAAPKADWVAIAPSDLLVMDLAPDAKQRPRRVVIQLMPPPFSQGWIGNIRKLAAAHWWDGLSINRVQDNYVVQWGDASEKKALPNGLEVMGEAGYIAPVPDPFSSNPRPVLAGERGSGRDAYSRTNHFFKGWPIALDYYNDVPISDSNGNLISRRTTQDAWPVHCYAMVGVGRNLPPDTGSGAELYAVIGHAPRHLDRNIALVGRVIEGIEHLSSLPRGTGPLGFYERPEERVPIVSVRIGSDLPAAAAPPRYEFLSTESQSFARFADARANRRDAFFVRPAGGADICNIAVPVRREKAK